MGWKFAIKIHTDKPINSELERLVINAQNISSPLIVRGRGERIKGSFWISLFGGPYDDPQSALLDAKKVYCALYCMTLTQRWGINFGNHKFAFDEVDSFDRFPRSGDHGLSIFEEKYESGVLIHIEINGVVSLSQNGFEDDLSKFLGFPINIPDHLRRSIILISDGLRLPSGGARFIIFMAAIEAACATAPASAEMKMVADSLIDHLGTLKLETALYYEIKSRLGQFKKVSHRRRCVTYIENILDEHRALIFSRLYDVRGSLVHEAEMVDMIGEHANDAMEIAISLTRAILDI
ncbi:hypothetical protein V5F29_10920 [Xanthobacter aminoxidans]|uniref:hypothetical protein n=1 Tax=Xanthobacter aminoxidans TaxID=186280 RepID=UPI00372984E2